MFRPSSNFPANILNEAAASIEQFFAKYCVCCDLLSIPAPQCDLQNLCGDAAPLKKHLESQVVGRFHNMVPVIQMGAATFLYEITGNEPDEQSLQASQIEQSLSELGKPTAVVAILAELNCNNHNQI